MTRARQSSKELAASVDEKLRKARTLGVRVEGDNVENSVKYLTHALDVVVDFGQSRVEEMPAWRPERIAARVK